MYPSSSYLKTNISLKTTAVCAIDAIGLHLAKHIYSSKIRIFFQVNPSQSEAFVYLTDRVSYAAHGGYTSC